MGFLAIDKVAIRNLFGLGIDIRWYGILIALGVAAGIAGYDSGGGHMRYCVCKAVLCSI